MKEIMEPDYSFIPASCEAALCSTLDLPTPSALPPPLAGLPLPLGPLSPSPVPPPSRRALILYALEARSPLIFSPLREAHLPDTLPLVCPPAPIDNRPVGPSTPSPLGFTVNTLHLVHKRQLASPVLDIIAAIVADDDTPAPPLPPANFSLWLTVSTLPDDAMLARPWCLLTADGHMGEYCYGPWASPSSFPCLGCGTRTDLTLDLTGLGFPPGWGPSWSDCVLKENLGRPHTPFSRDGFGLTR